MTTDKNNFKTVEKIVLLDGQKNKKRKMRVTYGFQYLSGNSEPYFSITGSLNGSSGCIHDDIVKYMPELAPLVQFHLWGQNTELPMYYIENGVYHFEQYKSAKGTQDMLKKAEIFKNHCLYQKDVDKHIVYIHNPEFWLKNRIPMLQERFNQNLNKFGIEKLTID